VAAQQDAKRPVIHDGERLTYAIRSSRFGDMGIATMRVDADTTDGHTAYRLSFDFSTKVMLFRVSDRTRSWVDAATLTTLRYSKRERSPVGNFDEEVRIMTEAGEWFDGDRTHRLASLNPLDELAFIYFVRGAARDVGTEGLTVERHFDIGRNPVRLTYRGTVRIAALGDSLLAREIQMEARDARQKNGTTKMTLYIGSDDVSLPLRIVTSMPLAGNLTMTLQKVDLGSAVGEQRTREGSGTRGQN
jgi:hypothetical protein